MTTDLFLILSKEVSQGKLTPEQSQQIGDRYLQLQADPDLTSMERSAIIRAYIQRVIYPGGDPDIVKPVVKESLTAQMKGQQVLFS